MEITRLKELSVCYTSELSCSISLLVVILKHSVEGGVGERLVNVLKVLNDMLVVFVSFDQSCAAYMARFLYACKK